jgi:membrane protein
MDYPAPTATLHSRRAFWRSVVWETWKSFRDPDTSPRCAAAAFFGFLSFFPAIATAVLAYGFFANSANVADLVDTFRYVVPGGVLDIAREQLKALAAQPPVTLGVGLLISIPLALWSGSRGVEALLFAMSRVRGEPERRSFLAELLVAVTLTAGGSLFLVIALVTIAGLPALIPFPTGAEFLVLLMRWPILLALAVGVLMVLYRWGPDRHPRHIRFIWPGAVLASVLWIVAGAIFSIYVENWGHYSATFGSVSAAVVLLLWLYNSAQIFVLGAALNTAIEHKAKGTGAASR